MNQETCMRLARRILPKIVQISEACSIADPECHFFSFFKCELYAFGLVLEHPSRLPDLTLHQVQSFLRNVERLCNVS